jgi:hypothetical protein
MTPMTFETTDRRRPERPANSLAHQRRVDALVAAYIHELSGRHRAEREAGKGESAAGEQRA